MANEKRKRSIKWKPGHACFLRSPSTHPFRVVRPEKLRGGPQARGVEPYGERKEGTLENIRNELGNSRKFLEIFEEIP